MSVTVRVTPGANWVSTANAATATQAGLLFKLDDWNGATLALRADGTVALCAITNGESSWCSATPLPASAPTAQGVYLRASQTGDALTGQVSADGIHWTPVGAWRLAWLPGPDANTGAYAPPTGAAGGSGVSSWTTFTSMGLYVASAGAQRSTPHVGEQLSSQFSAFTVTRG
jgi:regulation of enolase protein 1 (concanavalin A-like superfamily)